MPKISAITSKKTHRPHSRLIEAGSIEEVNHLTAIAEKEGYKIASLETNRNDFFRNYTILLVRNQRKKKRAKK